jgi:hypothetical protein
MGGEKIGRTADRVTGLRKRHMREVESKPHASSVRKCGARGTGDEGGSLRRHLSAAAICVSVVATLLGCGPSPEEIGERVRTSMHNNPDMRKLGVAVTRVVVIKESGNKYQGIADVRYKELERQVSVQVVAEGDNVVWKTEPGAFMFVLQHDFQQSFGALR